MSHTNVKHLSKAGKRKFLVFSLDDKRYGIPLSLIKEVIAVVDITPIPQVAVYYRGMINLRGQVISVIDLRLKLGLKDRPVDPKKTSILISHVGDIQLGAIVDEVIEVVAYEESQIDLEARPSGDRNHDGVYGVAKEANGSLTLLLDLKLALANTEFITVRESA